ncbi:MAG: metallophosphoesterase [Desulfarculaceae bacterium]|nr:metallophosphoesterase [Desulfarculaceae bacterium]MCF8071220.1 metallophosphoesterase [Desulfarculaceae bacterium]MCF8101177.1 metallophosphoesterase [Desulfarculaceae bacterium]MCF8115274.1 metallophosphoesterase [Desulfarculaceae bacterium]
MRWFLPIFFSVYTGLHIIFYRSARYLLPPGRAPRLIAWSWLGLMILGPMLTVLASMWGHPQASGVIGTVTYWWMGYLMISLLCLLGLSLLRLLAWPFSRGPWAWRRPVALALGAALMLTAYAGWSATQVRLKQVEIATAKLPAGMERLDIAVTSDLHLGLPGGEARLNRAIKLIRQAEPDLWIDAGDMWDRPLLEAKELTALMATVRPPLGKYAVGGNHENYVGLATSMSLDRAAGFVFLNNRGLAVGRALNLAGVVDTRKPAAQRDAAALKGLDFSRFTLLLRHRPDFNPAMRGKIDLQVSGHTHGGQVWPFHYVVKNLYPLFAGLYDLGQGTRVYTSRGTGIWGPPLRLLSPPEVTLIRLVRSPASPSR